MQVAILSDSVIKKMIAIYLWHPKTSNNNIQLHIPSVQFKLTFIQNMFLLHGDSSEKPQVDERRGVHATRVVEDQRISG